jgi:hypothetical protein
MAQLFQRRHGDILQADHHSEGPGILLRKFLRTFLAFSTQNLAKLNFVYL